MIPPGDRFWTRENVDLYFTRVIAGKTFKPESARRVVSALQWYADQIEYAGDPQGFQVDQKVVKEALEIHTRMYIERECSKVKDPHLNLPTNMMTEDEKIKILDTVLSENHSNWQDFCLSFTGCEQMMTRNALMRNFWLVDLKMNDTHGPDGFPDLCIMSCQLSMDVSHKKRSRNGHGLLELGDTKIISNASLDTWQ